MPAMDKPARRGLVFWFGAAFLFPEQQKVEKAFFWQPGCVDGISVLVAGSKFVLIWAAPDRRAGTRHVN